MDTRRQTRDAGHSSEGKESRLPLPPFLFDRHFCLSENTSFLNEKCIYGTLLCLFKFSYLTSYTNSLHSLQGSLLKKEALHIATCDICNWHSQGLIATPCRSRRLHVCLTFCAGSHALYGPCKQEKRRKLCRLQKN
ncbi:hypothetical protein DUNSADRAFT_3965 [Dunaliella salina]|uniref:Encoded protein n=1 Tax=Dunaliella salina TaxID=3046 RepID=A0ABQ7H7W6_DUNSA|nr:hypothetical protein DUNSADRAFT_3965 [Dunaliella salina]|eukprot:KAF5842938.1 hypothetical protein DUNSADRAFT_3965 [Dunaliella salina]